MKINILYKEQKKVLMKNNFVEKEKQILVKEIKQLINKLKDLY